MVGIQGPFYAGSGTFHRRNVVYGLRPGEVDHQGKYVNEFNGTLFSYFIFLLLNLFSFGHLDSILILAGADINIKVV